MRKCVVVNLFGTPSAGKSTGAAYIFSMLKMAGINAELVTEYAKDKVWEENGEVFSNPDNQVYIFGKQFYRMSRCADKVSVIITDSPLPISIIHNHSDILGENFNNMVIDCFNSFDNMTYLLTRDKPYNPKGRYETEAEADALGTVITDVLDKMGVSYETLKGNLDSYNKIFNDVMLKLKN